jgi:alkanesulfonate monooxygenase SsuD/methylene tetrahydromethanopterin reductase-like flavin-dependent oxidoreductase (luciferase family)
MIPFSVLDLSPIPEGRTAANALRNTRALAQHVERLGFHRFWLAEHHNMTGIASAATAVVIGYVAEATTTIRLLRHGHLVTIAALQWVAPARQAHWIPGRQPTS